MSYSVLAKFNMNGKVTKEGFLKKNICDVVSTIFFTIEMSNKNKATVAEIHNSMRSVLKYAPDRGGDGGSNTKSSTQTTEMDRNDE